ncbi:hypothetical protein [Paenibacillus sacheonensis]|uniref:Pilus assembly protein n=1 Tax=Paenibacillus sacheonensis TaxID=742054 RepID=A0A7X4YU30_9BACL|nr:hypothetical protein [Paenibacillus sacheonensis]MBM7566937.1 hypothetical protein [Paenibacillus sacheonensis]NBC71559.1 hypothetical protein [Paenibacillus sacheonensis]
MRKRRRSAALTDEQGERGSIALEASLVLPVVLMVVIFFIMLIKLSAAQMALHGAVSQTVRLAAANIHPIDLAVRESLRDDGDASELPDEGGAANEGSAASSGESQAVADRAAAQEPSAAVRFLADKLEGWLPPPSGPLLAAALRGDWKTIQDTAAAEVGRSIIEPMLRHEADTAILDPERLRLSKISLPDLKGRSDLFLSMEVEYAFKLGFPFTRKTVVLTERAEERVWTPDSIPSQRTGSASDSEHAPIQIVLVEPSPVRPGNKARVVVKTSPGRSLSIQVHYKSGQSTAKHLGDTVTDDEGMAEWTWLVSGNTTPGKWEIVVTAEDGTSAAKHFNVRKKQSEGEGSNG